MSFKILALCLLVGVALSASLTPRTIMSQAFDDLVVNMGSEFELKGLGAISGLNPVFKVSATEFTKSNPVAFLTELKAQLPHIVHDEKNAMALVESCQKVTDIVQFVHEIFEAIPNENAYRATLVIISSSQRGFKIASAVAKIPATTKITQNKLKHTLKISKFSLINTNSDEIIDNQGSLNAVEEKLKSDVSKEIWAKLKAARGSQSFDFYFAGHQRLGQSFTVFDAIKGVADAWKAVAKAFATVKKETLQKITRGQGFSTYKANSRFIRSIGVNTAYWSNYMSNMFIVTGLENSSEAQKMLHVYLNLAEFMPEQSFYFNEATFDQKHDGNAMSVVCLSNADMITSKANVLIVVTSGTFALDPDVYIYEQYKSVVGGLVQTTKEVRKNVPRDLTEADVKAIGALTMLNALNVMTKVFNIPFTLPEMPSSL